MKNEGMRTSRTDYTVLGCLSLRPMSGYDIKKLIDGSIGHFWSESYGQIYPSLQRLKREGLVRERKVPVTEARRRREYAVTEAGIKELRTWLEAAAQQDVVRYETSLKLFFGGQMPLEAAQAHVERYRSDQASQLEAYRAAAAHLERQQAGSPHLPYWSIVLDGGIRYAEMAVAWCDATLAKLSSLDPADYPAAALSDGGP